MKDKYYIELLTAQTKLSLMLNALIKKQTNCLKRQKISSFNYLTSEMFNKIVSYQEKVKKIYQKLKQDKDGKNNNE
ncbi:MAG: hypothetical protein ACI4TZ_03260 [Christensenellales bacterium]